MMTKIGFFLFLARAKFFLRFGAQNALDTVYKTPNSEEFFSPPPPPVRKGGGAGLQHP